MKSLFIFLIVVTGGVTLWLLLKKKSTSATATPTNDFRSTFPGSLLAAVQSNSLTGLGILSAERNDTANVGPG
jgi:hypothetical protein